MLENVAKQTLKVATFNLRRDSLLDFGNRWRYRKSYAIGELKRLGAAVVGVQELQPSMREDIIEQLNGYSVFGAARNSGSRGEHNDIFVDNEVAEVTCFDTFWLSKTPDKIGSRAYYAAYPRICTFCEMILRSAGQKIRVYNTHLDHVCTPAKRLGIRMILEHIRRADETERMPVIVMGDLNAKPGDSAIQMLTENSIRKFCNTIALSDEKEQRTYHGFSGRHHGQQIDYIFVSEEFRIESAQISRTYKSSRYPSDHYPVVATLTLS